MYRMIGADGREYGPITADQLRQWIGQGRANAPTSVLPEGASAWSSLGSLPEFSMLFAAPTPAPTPTPGPIPIPIAPSVFPHQIIQPPKTNGFAIAGLICGILSLSLGLCCCAGLPFSLPGVIFSMIALGQINSQPERHGGKTMATIGMILCCLCLLAGASLFLFQIGSMGWSSSSHHGYRL